MTSLEPFRHALAQLCPDFVPTGTPIRTGTSLLLPGKVNRTPVIAKHPTDPRTFWQNRCRHEIHVYRLLAAEHFVPVHTPRLVAADLSHPLLVTTRIAGRPLSPRRYHTAPVQPINLDRLLDTLADLHRWQPTSTFPSDENYVVQFAALRGPLLPPAILDRITELHRAAGATQLQHGDAHLGNVLDTGDSLALVDLELTARRPRGYDLAKLWIFLGPSPANRRRILGRVATEDHLVGFWLGVVLAVSREIISHRRHPNLPGGAARRRRLHADLHHALSQVRNLHNDLL